MIFATRYLRGLSIILKSIDSDSISTLFVVLLNLIPIIKILFTPFNTWKRTYKFGRNLATLFFITRRVSQVRQNPQILFIALPTAYYNTKLDAFVLHLSIFNRIIHILTDKFILRIRYSEKHLKESHNFCTQEQLGRSFSCWFVY